LNEYLLSILLGIIEGLTEFLPISSTAHLRIAEAFFGIDPANGYWKMYAIVIQLGAILCLPIYFRKRIRNFLATFPKGRNKDRNWLTHPLSLVLLSSTCTAIPALVLVKIIGKHLENLTLMGWSLIVGGVVMWVVDAIYSSPTRRPGTDDVEQMSAWQAVWIGSCQTLAAVFPGVSRSMATIAAGQIAGMSRPAALEFSFLISIPTMVAATGYDLFKSITSAGTDNPIGAQGINGHQWVLLAIGFVVSFVVAYGAVAWFMQWVRRRGFFVFAVYRIVFGVAVLLWLLQVVDVPPSETK
jgi:undecaprenyl-diphosphatase